LNAIEQAPNSGHENNLLASFTTSFLAILVCEIGDKTFFLAMIMAMKYNKIVVFIDS
jgi:putative Ca2+/H+ antiporter (TMEM165/GDT1 family)